MRRLTDFEGTWRLERQIDDALTGQTGHFTGLASFEAARGGLRYTEDGTLELGAARFAATRSYMWRAAGELVAVEFEDGRFFHDFDPAAPAPSAHHDCAPDVYDVRYDFSAWPKWRAVWAVKGPRKNYVSTSQYTCIAG